MVAAKGVALPDPNAAERARASSRKSFNRLSMLQHVDAGRRAEIDALNGAPVREARTLGVPVPANEALAALLKGRELARMRAVDEPELDYDAWEARIADRGRERRVKSARAAHARSFGAASAIFRHGAP